MKLTVEELIYKNNTLLLRGTAAPNRLGDGLFITLFTPKGGEIVANIRTFLRPDVLQEAYGLSALNEDHEYGFSISAKEIDINSTILDVSSLEDASDHAALPLRYVYKKADVLKKRAKQILRANGKIDYLKHFRKYHLSPENWAYYQWFLKQSPSEDVLSAQRATVFSNGPKFSVLVPIYHPVEHQLRAMIASVLSQTYSNFELCLANSCPDDEKTTAILKEYAEKDARVLVKDLEENYGISGNTNEALSMASGDFVLLLDQDDLYTEDALFEYAKAISKDETIDVLYSDEDKLDDGTGALLAPFFKPDYSPEKLSGNNYFCHLLGIRRSIALSINGERKEYDGAQDYDFTLRAVREARTVKHVAKVLYHWRIHSASTAGDMGAKQYAIDAGRRAIADDMAARGFEGIPYQISYPGWYAMKPQLTEKPLVSILIPNKDHVDDLKRCVDSLFTQTTYENFELLIVENNSKEEATFAYYEDLKKAHKNVRILTWTSAFNYAAICNFAARNAHGEYLLLLNNDTEVISADFIESMMAYAKQTGVGAVGAKLLYEDRTIQHAGVIVGGGQIAHAYTGLSDLHPGYMGELLSPMNCSAVTGACMLVKKSVYFAVFGMDESFPVAYNDIDFCMKLRKAGLRIVCDTFAKLYHFESKSRGYEDTNAKKERLASDFAHFKEKWPQVDAPDPYHSAQIDAFGRFIG